MDWKEVRAFLQEEKAQGEWSSVYLLLVLVIAALILISIIKPMFQQSQEIRTKVQEEVSTPQN